eukprot:g42201.t1
MEPEEVCEVINEYFACVFTKEKDENDSKIREEYVDILEHVNNKKKEEMLAVLQNIKVEKSPDLDGIYRGILRISAGITVACDINDLDVNLGDLISKFKDDMKIGGVVGSEEDYRRIQRDIDQLESWMEKRQVEFNLDKCEVKYSGKSDDVEVLEMLKRRLPRILPELECIS